MCAREGFAWGRGPLAHHLVVCACVDGVGFSPPKRSAQHQSDRGSSPVRIIILILLLLPITHSPARGGTAAQERKVSQTRHATILGDGRRLYVLECKNVFWPRSHSVVMRGGREPAMGVFCHRWLQTAVAIDSLGGGGIGACDVVAIRD